MDDIDHLDEMYSAIRRCTALIHAFHAKGLVWKGVPQEEIPNFREGFALLGLLEETLEEASGRIDERNRAAA